MNRLTGSTLVVCFLVMLVATVCSGPTEAKVHTGASGNHHSGNTSGGRHEKMLRLCLWTQCRQATSLKKCPDYLQQSAKRKCKLDNGEIGFYSKCCIYEEPFNLQKS